MEFCYILAAILKYVLICNSTFKEPKVIFHQLTTTLCHQITVNGKYTFQDFSTKLIFKQSKNESTRVKFVKKLITY